MSLKVSRSGPACYVDNFEAEIPASFEGLDPRFRPKVVEKGQRELRANDFNCWEVDPSIAFSPIPNVVNSESVLVDDSEVGSRLLESIILPRDRHLLQHCRDSSENLALKISQSLTVVSTVLFYICTLSEHLSLLLIIDTLL